MSGTTSIVGHALVHQDDPVAQTDETLSNLHALTVEANRRVRAGYSGIGDYCALKVYVRDRRHLPLIKRQVAAAIDQSVPVMYLEGDVCRPDLLVEIEGVVQSDNQRGPA